MYDLVFAVCFFFLIAGYVGFLLLCIDMGNECIKEYKRSKPNFGSDRRMRHDR